jgi:hypothetical protein
MALDPNAPGGSEARASEAAAESLAWQAALCAIAHVAAAEENDAFAVYQPHFLNEFIVENMDPRHSSAAYVESAEMRSAAQEALGLSTSVS